MSAVTWVRTERFIIARLFRFQPQLRYFCKTDIREWDQTWLLHCILSRSLSINPCFIYRKYSWSMLINPWQKSEMCTYCHILIHTSSAGESLNFPFGMGNPLPKSFEAISAPYSTVTSSSMAPTKRQNSFSTSSVGTIYNEGITEDIPIIPKIVTARHTEYIFEHFQPTWTGMLK